MKNNRSGTETIGINKKSLDDELDGTITLKGLRGHSVMDKGEMDKPEIALFYEHMPKKYKDGLKEIAELAKEKVSGPDEVRYIFPKRDIVVTDIKSDEKYVREHKELLAQGEVVWAYVD
jgi:hypothetical protein